MTAELVKLCDPDAYYDSFIVKGIYPDGRPISAFSAISFKNEQYGGVGSSVVRQGGITISCVITAEIRLESDDPLLVPKFEGCHDINEVTQNEVLDTVNELLALQEVIPRSALTCKGTEDSIPLCWRLTITIRVLNSSGNLCDAVVGAVSYALASVKLPHIKSIHAKDDEAPIEKSEINVLPEKSTISLKDFPQFVILSDPPTEIFSECATTCTVVAGKDRILNFKLRGLISDENLLNKIFEMAIGRQKSVANVMLA